MKSKNSIPYFSFVSASLIFFVSNGAFAQSSQDGTWGAGSENGNWSDTSKWSNGKIAGGAGATATLANPTAVTKPILTIGSGETVVLGTLQSNAVPSNRAYTVSGAGTLHFDNNGGPARIIMGTGTAGVNLTVGVRVTGSNGLLIQGSNDATQLNWFPTVMELTGGITVEGGGLHISNGAALGNNTIRLGSRVVSGTERFSFLGVEESTGSDTSVTISNNIVLESNGSGLKYSNSNSSQLRTVHINGVISESGGPRQMNYVTDTVAGNGLFIVSGNNTYTGNTVIGDATYAGGVVVRATHNGAFGAGNGAKISFTSAKTAVQLAGNVTISNKTIKLNGLGYGNAGSLNSVSGDNTWAGDVELGAEGENRVQVDAGRLTISGRISGANDLGKTGSGTLELAAANVHTGATLVRAGTLLLSHDEALASSALSLSAGAALEIGSGIAAKVSSLTLTHGAGLTFAPDALGQPLLTITGNQWNAGGSSDLYEITILGSSLQANQTYALLLVEGASQLSLNSFHLNIATEFAGSTLTWANGQLNLEVIPEASTVQLSLLGGVAMLGLACRRAKCRQAA